MSQFHMRLLGALQIEQNGKTLTQFRSRRAVALLVYLIANNRPIPRSELVELIWPDKTEKQGRGNLRWALNYLSKTIPSGLETTRHTVQFAASNGCTVDVLQLANAMTKGASEQLATLLLDVQGEFLAGFYFDESAEFETWLITQRETWRLRLLDAIESQITNLASNNNYATGLLLAEKWLSIEPWAEAAHRWTMQLLARQGRTEAALEQYERCWRMLAEELGTEPTDETTRLYQRLQQTAAQPRHNLPTQPTGFVGRHSELETLVSLVRQPDLRLVTIVGPGGMGKTRLALEAGEQLIDHFIDGVVFVELARVASAENVASAALNALSESGIASPTLSDNSGERQLFQLLHDKELLLILDNFEHVIDAADMLVSLLQAAPRVQLVITSRERLNIRWERLVELHGLPSQQAFTLFVQTAKRARPSFKIRSANRSNVQAICKLVDGMPLAIELAAAWTRMQSCSDIARTIQEDIDILTSSQRDTPDRHRSVRAVFESSWRLLEPLEQEQLGKLALFVGGFSAESARAVTGATWATLAPLVDKSLISQTLAVSANGTLVRYGMHELLRQFSAEKLAPKLVTETRNRLATHFATFLHERNQLTQQGDPTALNEIGREIANIKQAWAWSNEQAITQNIAIAGTPLAYFYDMRSRWQESIQAFESAVAMLRTQADSDPLAHVTLGASSLSLGNSYTRAMRYTEAETALETGRQILGAIGHREGLIFALFALARVRGLNGAEADAQQLYRESLALATEDKNLVGMARAQVNLSSMAVAYGDWEEARSLAMISRDLFEQFGDQRGIAVAGLNLSHADYALGQYQTAQQQADLAQSLAREIGAVSVIGGALRMAAMIALAQADTARCHTLLTDASALFSSIGDDAAVIGIWKMQGEVALLEGRLTDAANDAGRIAQLGDHLDYLPGRIWGWQLKAALAEAQGDLISAETSLRQALQLVQPTRYRPAQLELLAAWARVKNSAELNALVAHHPAATHALRQTLPPLSAAQNGQSPSLNAAIQMILEKEPAV